MRAFIAIPLPERLHGYLDKLQGFLRETGADAAWVKPENVHLTLRFLGEIDESEVEKVKTAMQEACAGTGIFRISLSGLGGFPSRTSPRVIWIGITEGAVQAEEIAGRLGTRLCGVGKQEDRRFAAHITLGRTRSGRNRKELAAAIEEAGRKYPPPPPFEASSITLFQSKLSPKGPAYIPIFETPLKE